MLRAICALLVLASGTLAACSSSDDAASGNGTVGGCLERPGELPRPPTGSLPCDLLPPGLSLK